mmetsp:Transcript_3910/g.13156  ORF Transcript_3910/g.13156 Transcript_3910/m.13156 type:complete len:243 (+) Transcript_3910:5361-6089(+)
MPPSAPMDHPWLVIHATAPAIVTNGLDETFHHRPQPRNPNAATAPAAQPRDHRYPWHHRTLHPCVVDGAGYDDDDDHHRHRHHRRHRHRCRRRHPWRPHPCRPRHPRPRRRLRPPRRRRSPCHHRDRHHHHPHHHNIPPNRHHRLHHPHPRLHLQSSVARPRPPSRPRAHPLRLPPSCAQLLSHPRSRSRHHPRWHSYRPHSRSSPRSTARASRSKASTPALRSRLVSRSLSPLSPRCRALA